MRINESVDAAHLESRLAGSLCSVSSSCYSEELYGDVGGDGDGDPL